MRRNVSLFLLRFGNGLCFSSRTRRHRTRPIHSFGARSERDLIESIKRLLVQPLSIILIDPEAIIHRHIRVQPGSDKRRAIGAPRKISARIVRVIAEHGELVVFNVFVIIKGHFSRQITKSSAPQKPAILAKAHQIASIMTERLHRVAAEVEQRDLLRMVVDHHELFAVWVPRHILQFALLADRHLHRHVVARREQEQRLVAIVRFT
mmetsp:Transcript_3886/g.6530  ORF Transcript_3886/g.6530 Transcript_3886/m.6530 type:complete len:207 (+) Transcript_3886:251-871(+)